MSTQCWKLMHIYVYGWVVKCVSNSRKCQRMVSSSIVGSNWRYFSERGKRRISLVEQGTENSTVQRMENREKYRELRTHNQNLSMTNRELLVYKVQLTKKNTESVQRTENRKQKKVQRTDNQKLSIENQELSIDNEEQCI